MLAQIQIIALDKISINNSQPRESFDKEKLQELAESILSNGQINPIIVRVKGNGFILVAGERRWKAHKLAGLKSIQAIVKEYKNDVEWQIESLVENWQREDLTSVEKENSVFKLWNTNQFKSYTALANKIGCGEGTISSIILARDTRTKTKAPESITTRTISDTQGLEDKDRKHIFEKVEKGELSPAKVRDVTRAIKQATPDVKRALLDDKINVEQAERISKLDDKDRARAIVEHSAIKNISKHIEKNIINHNSAKNDKEFDKRLVQAKTWINAFKYSITESRNSLEKTFKTLMLSTKFLQVMDDAQKDNLEQQLDRFLEILEKSEQLAEKIKGEL